MDALLILLALSSLVVTYYLAKLYWWAWFWTGMIVLATLFELAAKLHTSKTLSQQFWAYSLVNKDEGLGLGILVIAGGIGLGVHLLWKLLKVYFS